MQPPNSSHRPTTPPITIKQSGGRQSTTPPRLISAVPLPARAALARPDRHQPSASKKAETHVCVCRYTDLKNGPYIFHDFWVALYGSGDNKGGGGVKKQERKDRTANGGLETERALAGGGGLQCSSAWHRAAFEPAARMRNGNGAFRIYSSCWQLISSTPHTHHTPQALPVAQMLSIGPGAGAGAWGPAVRSPQSAFRLF